MRGRWLVLGLLLVALALLALNPAGAQLPRSVTLGTNPPGSIFYTVASGLAKAVSQAAPFQMALQPYAGTSTFLPLLNSGEMGFGVVNAVDMVLTYRGPDFKVGGRNPFPHAPNVRLVMRGSPLLVGLLVRKDSPIKSIRDIKGKRCFSASSRTRARRSTACPGTTGSSLSAVWPSASTSSSAIPPSPTGWGS